MKTIICDQFGLHSVQATDLIVEEETHYATALEYLKTQPVTSDIRVVVRNPALFHWFDAPARQTGCTIVHLEPVTALKNKLHRTTLPKALRDHPAWIIELKLLDKATEFPVKDQESAEAWLQRVLLGGLGQAVQAVENFNLADLLVWLAAQHDTTLHPLAHQLLAVQLERWLRHEGPLSELLRWLAPAPFNRSRIVIWRDMLRAYPPHRVANWFQLETDWHSLSFISDFSQHLPPVQQSLPLPEGISVFLQTFLTEEWQKSPLQALAFISGRLLAEQRFLRNTLMSCLETGTALDDATYQKICAIHAFPEAAELAVQLIPASEPDSLTESASVTAMQLWLQEEYLPFYHACVRLKRIEETAPYIMQFEAWLKQHYAQMLIDGAGMAYRRIRHLKNSLDKGPVLLYVFDGLDYLSAREEILPFLEKAGAHAETDIAPCLAFLPSETSIAKPPLVCGRMASQLPPEQPDAAFYRKLFSNALELAETDVVSATDRDSSLYELVQRPASCYLYLDNHLDREYLHAAINSHTRHKQYRKYVRQQAQAVVDAVQAVKHVQGKMLTIALCSDHGYTELPLSIPVIGINSTRKQRTRSMIMAEAGVSSEGDADLIWRLKPGIYGLQTEMAITRGYGCLEKRPKGATHGGCTPQEVAVPWFLLTFRKTLPFLPPLTSVEGDIFRRRKLNPLRLMFSNPNPFNLTVVEIAIDGIEALTTALPLHLPPHQTGYLEADCDASTINTQTIHFYGTVKTQHQYEQNVLPVSLTVTTIGAMSDDFDDDFEV